MLSQYRDRATGWTTGVQFPAGAMMGIFLPSHLNLPWGPPSLLSNGYRVKRLGREADLLPPSSAEVNAWSYTCVFMAWCLIKQGVMSYLIKYRDKFTLPLPNNTLIMLCWHKETVTDKECHNKPESIAYLIEVSAPYSNMLQQH
jgi:hypothetical protein